MRAVLIILCLCLMPAMLLAEEPVASNSWLKPQPQLDPPKPAKTQAPFEMSFGQSVPGTPAKPGLSATWRASGATSLSAGLGCPMPGAPGASGQNALAPSGSVGLSVSF